MRSVRSLSGLAGSGASLKDAGGGVSGYGSMVFPIAGTFSWTVPEGVSELFIVCVGAGSAAGTNAPTTVGGQSSVKRADNTVICSANGGNVYTGGSGGVKDGGGNGGNGRTSSGGSGGGAGGYSGNGGAARGAGSGGGGGSGASSGGGVGIWGEGANGTAGGGGGSGGAAKSSSPSTEGGVFGGSAYHGAGGELSWVNNIPVSPGEVLSVIVGNKNGVTAYQPGSGVVAIYWGDVGEFPTLANVSKPF